MNFFNKSSAHMPYSIELSQAIQDYGLGDQISSGPFGLRMFAPKQGAKVGDRYISEFSPTGVTRFETVKSPEEAERQRRGQLISELKNHLLGLGDSRPDVLQERTALVQPILQGLGKNEQGQFMFGGQTLLSALGNPGMTSDLSSGNPLNFLLGQQYGQQDRLRKLDELRRYDPNSAAGIEWSNKEKAAQKIKSDFNMQPKMPYFSEWQKPYPI
jgi:hypothetical protein